jgi:hypothetical protein
VVHLITREYGKEDANFSLIIKAKELLAREWVVKVQHAFREANAAAYWLANLGLSMNPLDRNNWIINDPSMGLYLILFYDLVESTRPRLI